MPTLAVKHNLNNEGTTVPLGAAAALPPISATFLRGC